MHARQGTGTGLDADTALAGGDRTAAAAVTTQVAVLIPTRNESQDIRRALDAVVAQDFPHDAMEIVVVDGASTDDTAQIAWDLLADAGFASVVVVDNPVGHIPSNLNVGLKHVTAPIVCRVDSRSIIPSDYVRRCVTLLNENSKMVVVGGSQIGHTRDESALARGITRALNNRWGMGFARYRRGAPSGPADTVYLGAFRTEELRDAGGWDERFQVNEDYELNRRMGRHGIVWFDQGLEVGYLPRTTLWKLFRQYRRFGHWKVTYWRTTGDPPQRRQLFLITAPVGALAGFGYLAVRRRRWFLPAFLAAVAGLFAIEVKGADQPEGNAVVHGVAATALGVIGLGWTLGVWEALLGRRHSDCAD